MIVIFFCFFRSLQCTSEQITGNLCTCETCILVGGKQNENNPTENSIVS